jgi:mycothiol system anti-sigma-R factor
MTDCNDALHELYTFLDGELTDEKRAQIKHHIDDCGSCLEVFDFEVELRHVVQRKCQESVPDALKAKIARALQAAASGAPEEAEPPTA